MTIHARSARVRFRNTPETDAMPVVEHLVTLSNGTTISCFASDPMDAIKRMNDVIREDGEEVLQYYPKVKE